MLKANLSSWSGSVRSGLSPRGGDQADRGMPNFRRALQPAAGEASGLSGPLFAPPRLQSSPKIYRSTEGRLPLVGVGGIGSVEDAYASPRRSGPAPRSKSSTRPLPFDSAQP